VLGNKTSSLKTLTLLSLAVGTVSDCTFRHFVQGVIKNDSGLTNNRFGGSGLSQPQVFFTFISAGAKIDNNNRLLSGYFKPLELLFKVL